MHPVNERLKQPGGLAERLYGLRRDAGLTQVELAAGLGWPATKISKIENGNQPPSAEDIRTWAARCGHPESADGLLDIAKRARGTPRIANGLLARVRDFANGRTVDSNMLANTFELEGIDPDGSDESDRAYIACLRDRFKGGPAGIMAIAATMNESRETLESVIEPWLLVQGKIGRTSRGRVLL